MTRAYCGGTFDLLHPGHVRCFRWAKENFDTVIVSLNSDAFVRRYKGAWPAQPFTERREMVEACRWVDEVTLNIDGEDSRPSILASRATHVVNGSDWSREKLMVQMRLTEAFMALHKIEIALCPMERIFSTTELKKRILENGKH